MSEFEPQQSFGIDDGELDGLSPQKCFVLGVEYQMVYAQSRRPEPFERPVHAENADRLRSMLSGNGREFQLTYMPDDVSESWMWLAVAPYQAP